MCQAKESKENKQEKQKRWKRERVASTKSASAVAYALFQAIGRIHPMDTYEWHAYIWPKEEIKSQEGFVNLITKRQNDDLRSISLFLFAHPFYWLVWREQLLISLMRLCLKAFCMLFGGIKEMDNSSPFHLLPLKPFYLPRFSFSVASSQPFPSFLFSSRYGRARRLKSS